MSKVTNALTTTVQQANICFSDQNGETALLCAAFEGHFDVVRILVSKGADVNAKGNPCVHNYCIIG
jgi:ankyrin repeat protein